VTAERGYPARSAAWAFVLVLALAGVVSAVDRFVLNLVVDPVRADLGLTEIQIGLLQGLAFGLFYATVGLPLGLTADRYSRRWIVIIGIAVWSLATAASGLVQSFGAMFAALLRELDAARAATAA
jgi:predicted MFS family arabinose efflux permease